MREIERKINMNIRETIQNLVEFNNLTQEQTFNVATDIMSGKTTDAQISAFLVSLRLKGETTDEITGFVRAMRKKAVKISCRATSLVDTCGTGGDQIGTFNISTLSAFVAAGAGCRVAKHGNRSVSSKCGSADLLLELGINIEIPPEKIANCIDESGIGFLYAPFLHKAMKFAIGPRREIGVRTIFNVLGPLTNPVGARCQLIGVFDESLTELLANVLKKLGSEHVLVVHGEDGMDEITITGKTKVSELTNGEIKNYTIQPEDFGLRKAMLGEIKGGDAKINAKIATKLLEGEKGPARDIILLNAGAVIYVGGKAKSIQEGIKLAEESINSGAAKRKLESLKILSNAN
jgi:anthranilate phosphoribosyltransferase